MPDLSAGSFRTTAFVQSLRNKIADNDHIDVVTSLPNRYETFSHAAEKHENHDGLDIFRIELPSHKSGMFDQAIAYIKFFKNVNSLVSKRDYDLVYATSSRLMTAALGAWIASRNKARLYLDIRDIFVDTIKDVLSRKVILFIRPVFSILERWTINKADKVNLVSEGFRSYFDSRYPEQKFSFFTNGVDDEFIRAGQNYVAKETSSIPVKVLYAGNMGEGQGLQLIIPKLAKKLKNRVDFILIGDGGRKTALQDSLNKENCTNVELRQPVNRSELIKAYLAADVLFLHLNDCDAFKKVLPSKLFEYAALGKPIWAGVSGYAAEFIKNEIDNAAVFPPCNVDAAVDSFDSLVLGDKKRPEFIAKFSRTNIMNLLVNDVLSIMQKKS